MKLPWVVWLSLLVSVQLCCGMEGPRLFPPLKNDTPIAAFASKSKAMVSNEGWIQQLRYSPDPHEFDWAGRWGPRLQWQLAGHDQAAAQTTQRYTDDPAPAVETIFEWPDARLTMTAFAADPEGLGYFVRYEISNLTQIKGDYQIELTVVNVEAHPVEGGGIFGTDGHVLLRVVPVTAEQKPAVWQAFPGAPPGIRITLPAEAQASASVAVQMPIEDETSQMAFDQAQRATQATWSDHLAGAVRLNVPDKRLQKAWQDNIKQLFMLLQPQRDGLRIVKGLGVYFGSNPYDTLQGSLILDRLGYPDLAEALLRRQLKRARPDGVFEMWEEEVPPTRPPDQWIVQGLTTFGMWKHYEITRDRRWLEEIGPVILRSAKATMRARTLPSANGTQGGITIRGFMPPGEGDGGIPNGYTLPQNFGPLTGLWVTRQIAGVLAWPEKALLDREYEEYRKNILDVMRAATIRAGEFSVVPSYPGAGPDDALRHLWGTVEGVYPFGQLAVDDPVVLGTLRFLQAHEEEGLHLNLGYSQGVWPYMSAALAHWHLRLGEFDEAFRIQQAILDHASPTWGWYEEIEHNPPQGFADIPDVWATCELLHVTRELLLLEKGDSLLLAPSIPNSWTQPGKKLSLDTAPTLFGPVSYNCEWADGRAEATIRVTLALAPKSIRLKLLPEGVHAKVKATGAVVESVEGRFVNLAKPNAETIRVETSW